jgi:hypothetical protein
MNRLKDGLEVNKLINETNYMNMSRSEEKL